MRQLVHTHTAGVIAGTAVTSDTAGIAVTSDTAGTAVTFAADTAGKINVVAT